MRKTHLPIALSALAVVIPVGLHGVSAQGAGTPVITIQDFAYSPADLRVAPGATVTVRNLDSALHSVTSESKPGSYTPGSVAGVSFDTGTFPREERTFKVPSNAPLGTVVPYYCTVHKGTMRNEGRITIVGQR
jgi:plastocyanin